MTLTVLIQIDILEHIPRDVTSIQFLSIIIQYNVQTFKSYAFYKYVMIK